MNKIEALIERRKIATKLVIEAKNEGLIETSKWWKSEVRRLGEAIEEAQDEEFAKNIRNCSMNNLADVRDLKVLDTLHGERISQLEETVEYMKHILEKNNVADLGDLKALETLHSRRISLLEDTTEFMKDILEKNDLTKFDSYRK